MSSFCKCHQDELKLNFSLTELQLNNEFFSQELLNILHDRTFIQDQACTTQQYFKSQFGGTSNQHSFAEIGFEQDKKSK